jgi:hypothetical protein
MDVTKPEHEHDVDSYSHSAWVEPRRVPYGQLRHVPKKVRDRDLMEVNVLGDNENESFEIRSVASQPYRDSTDNFAMTVAPLASNVL